jgi:hypothetical protein
MVERDDPSATNTITAANQRHAETRRWLTPSLPRVARQQSLPVIFAAVAPAALHVGHDSALGLVVIACAAEPSIRVLLAPEVAIDLALRLTGAVNALRSAGR